MTPGNRLLFVTAALVGPLAALAGLGVAPVGVCAALVIALAAVAVADGVAGKRRLARVSLTLPEVLRMRMALELPAGLPAVEAVVPVELPAGDSEVLFALTAEERGRHSIGQVHIECSSPLGAWAVAGTRAARCEVRAYPDLRDQPSSLSMLRRNPAGFRVARPVGKGREFEKLREYAPGDSFDEIYWKATARRSRPVVKLFQTEHSQEVYAVVDASRLTARGDTLDRYVNAALHLLITAQEHGDRIGLITFSDQVHKLVKAGSSGAHFRACREAIYALQPRRVSPDYRELFTSIQLNLRKRSLLVFLTALDDPALAETFVEEVPLIARRHLVLVNVPRGAGVAPLFSGGQAGELYEGLAGQLMWNKLMAVERLLRLRGVRFAMLEPAEMSASLSAMYLDVKRRQLL
ncbi:MAG: DUF58 domain-containing protein [Acidobacteria bacterium]|nr:DUF58 domain-containing protein [Acidobacteriota bacterium]